MRILLLILSFLYLFTINTFSIQIGGVEIEISGDVVTGAEFERVVKIVRSMQDRGYVNASLEIAEYLKEKVGPDYLGRGTIEYARALFYTMEDGFKKSYEILKDYKMKNLINEDFEREYFTDTVISMVTNPIKMRTMKSVSVVGSSTEKCFPDEYLLESVYDLQWSVNFLDLIRDIDGEKYKEGKSEIDAIIDKKQKLSIYIYHQSTPQISIERAKDEAFAGISKWNVGNVSGSLVRELDRKFNITGFGLCVGRPISMLNVSQRIKDDIEFGEVRIERTIKYEADGYDAYRAIAYCEAVVELSVAQLFEKYGINAHSFKPFVPKAPLINKDTDEDEDIGQ